jgi:hypothetical protein
LAVPKDVDDEDDVGVTARGYTLVVVAAVGVCGAVNGTGDDLRATTTSPPGGVFGTSGTLVATTA